MKQRADDEERVEQEKESDEFSKAVRKKEIEELDAKLRSDREKLKALRAENVEKNKSIGTKRKLTAQVKKERGNELTQRPEISEEPAIKRVRKVNVKTEKNAT
jgi:hypothetical protein